MALNRRKFIGASAAAIGAAALSAKSYARIIGANDRVNIGFMGVRSRGEALVGSAINAGGVNITHICDVDSRVQAKSTKTLAKAGFSDVKVTDDIRKTLEDPELDAIAIATPDHWHAPAGIMALQAGKHVYVEKPISHNPHEGELFIKAQQKYNRVVQMGNQQRSSVESIELIKLLREGMLGDVYRVETWYGNARGSIGNGKKVPPPDWLNWELWQGPAPRQNYQDNYVHYNWHWFWHWGTGELCNNAAHELDIARWAVGGDYPEEVSTLADRHFYKDDDWEMYDTMYARYTFPGGKTIEWSGNSCNRILRYKRGRGALIMGTKGHVIIDRGGYEVYNLADELVTKRTVEGRATSTGDLAGGGHLTDLHMGNFLDTVRGKATHQSSPAEEGHKSTLMCHLGNIAYRTKSTLKLNPENGHIIDNPEAEKLWQRSYEKGWSPEKI